MFVEDLVAEQMFSEKAMTQEIRDALAEDRVEVYYQPIYSIDEQRFTSAEALEKNIRSPARKLQRIFQPGAPLKRIFQQHCNNKKIFVLAVHLLGITVVGDIVEKLY